MTTETRTLKPSLLEVTDLRVYFDIRETPFRKKQLRAVDGVSLTVGRGENVGLVGESGCGKTTLGRTVIGLLKPTGGTVTFDGRDVTAIEGRELKKFRRSAQIIFQDPFDSLNPRLTVGSVLGEVLDIHKIVPRDRRRERIAELLKSVGMDARYINRYPHEFSGGQRQRIGIARALAADPVLLVADEPVSALDVSVQVQILNLMKDLQKKLNLSYLFIAHDLAVVRYMCERILVMYLGKIVESAGGEELFGHPSHPYTRALLSAIPDVDKGLLSRKQGSTRIVLKGDVPSATQVIPGCRFHPRCPLAESICRSETPPVVEVSPGHTAMCHFAGKL